MQKITGAILLAILHTIPCLGAEVERKEEAAAKWIPPMYEAPGVKPGIKHEDVRLELRERSGSQLFYNVNNHRRVWRIGAERGSVLEPFKNVTIPLPDHSKSIDVSMKQEPQRTGTSIIILGDDNEKLSKLRDGSQSYPRTMLLFVIPSPHDLIFGRMLDGTKNIDRKNFDRKTFYIDLVKNETEVGPKILASVGEYSRKEEEALYKQLAAVVPQFLVTPVAPMVCKYLIGDAAYDYEHKRAEAALSASGGSRSEGNGFGAGPVARALLGRSLKGVRKSPASVSAEATANTAGTNAGPGSIAE